MTLSSSSALAVAAEANRLAALWSYDAARREVRASLAPVVAALARFYGARYALASLVDAATVHVIAAAGFEAAQLPRRDSFCTHVVTSPDSVLVVPDAALDARFCTLPCVAGLMEVRSYAGVALGDGGGHALGALAIMHTNPLAASALPLHALHRAAEQAMQALGGAQSAPILEARREAKDDAARADAPWAGAQPPKPARPQLWLGIRAERSGPLGWGRGSGRRITGVATDSPASRAGLRVGDVLLAMDGCPTRRQHDIEGILARHRTGDIIAARVLRGWTTHTCHLQVEPMPANKQQAPAA